MITDNPCRGLVIAPAWVGDAVMAQVLLKALRRQQTNLILDVAAPAPLIPLFERMADVNQVIELPFKHGQFALIKRIRLGRALRRYHYDSAWILPNSWKSALIPFFARAKQRTGWLGERRYLLLNDWRKLDKQRLPWMAERFLALSGSMNDWHQPLSTLPRVDDSSETFSQRYPQFLPTLRVSAEQCQHSCQAVNFEADSRPLLALCPGAAFGWSKRWLPEYFAEVAKHYLHKGWRVAIFGVAEDEQAAAIIMAATEQQCHNFVGQTTLAQAIDLLSLAQVVVTNDSGLMHIACALARRVVAIYGSSSPQFTPPLGHNVAICYLAIACSPCFARDCPLKHFRCMREVLPQYVITEVDRLYAPLQRGQS